MHTSRRTTFEEEGQGGGNVRLTLPVQGGVGATRFRVEGEGAAGTFYSCRERLGNESTSVSMGVFRWAVQILQFSKSSGSDGGNNGYLTQGVQYMHVLVS
ncbi:hypothetical protein IRJ41_001983 [Triplophysa rosa]|uniref:Uncharacterized protein n=1 Tax=Triplophysa rosa TaxID=992332 RepID=A0A9W8C6F3_TRIRA|nr:hypothetical protein IRJ41_001983 [Triplophysa rosa]